MNIALSADHRGTNVIRLLAEKLLQRRGKFGFRIPFPVRREEKPRIVLLAFDSAEPAISIMQEQAPFPLIRQTTRGRFLDQSVLIGGHPFLTPHDGGGQEEDQEREEKMHDGAQTQRGPGARPEPRSGKISE